jgi:glycosyltransferase involved in cell wall biosynthesis
MKIVIVGEYSGFAKNLSIGIRNIGHECLVFSWGDVFKKIEPDESTYLIEVGNCKFWGKSVKGLGLVRKCVSSIKLHKYIKRRFEIEKADVVLVMNVAFLKENSNIFEPKFSNDMLLYMCKSPDGIYMSSCGNDYIVNRYLPFNERTNEYLMYKKNSGLKKQKKKFDGHIGIIKKVIPIAHDYALAYRYSNKEYDYTVLPTIPLPFDVSSVETSNVIRDRIVIMHGVSRPFEKGSYVIISALERMAEEYPDKVDIRIVKNLPLKEYLKVIQESNIVVDQCYGGSCGMNSIESLSMGKVVLSGNIKGYNREYTDLESPVIDIEPKSEQIYCALKKLVLNPELIKEISLKSRAYAERVHDCKIVAQKYLDAFLRDI